MPVADNALMEVLLSVLMLLIFATLWWHFGGICLFSAALFSAISTLGSLLPEDPAETNRFMSWFTRSMAVAVLLGMGLSYLAVALLTVWLGIFGLLIIGIILCLILL